MKKYLLAFLIGLLACSVTILAQEAPTRPADGPKRPSAPRAIRDNDQFRVWAANFRTAREDFRTQLQEMRQSLAKANDSEKQAIRTQIRQHLKEHQKKQLQFQKNVRGLMRELREKRANDGATSSP